MRYDVFISFVGEEIRKTFLSHLLHSLDRKGIKSVASATSSPSTNQAFPRSVLAISIISKNCTSLDLWVEELDAIISSTRKVVPVFLLVDPLDVLTSLNLAHDLLRRSDPGWWNLERVKTWLEGHVTNKSGFNSNDWEDDSQLVDQITRFVSDTVKQDSISNRSCPELDWLRSPWVRDIMIKPSPPVYQKISGLYQSRKPNISSRRRKAFIKSKLSSASESPMRPVLHSINTPETDITSSSDVSHTSPVLQHINTPEADIKSSPDASHTSPVLHPINTPETEIKSSPDHSPFTNMNPFAEPSTTEEASYCDTRYMKQRVQEVLSMLRKEDSTNEFSTIGIYGMEGVGKTTLAKRVYEEISPQFQHHFFVTNFSKKGSSLLEIIASETLNTSTKINDIIEDIVGRKVLLVVDSAEDIKQLKGFTKEVRLFGPGSRVIVITQDRSLLFQCGVKLIYEIRCPGYEEAIQLFSQFAFRQAIPTSGFERFSDRAVEVAGRIPLALKLLGSYLYGKEKHEWETTLCGLQESYHNYTTEEVLKYIGADNTTPTAPTILEELGENEENRFPLYSFTF